MGGRGNVAPALPDIAVSAGGYLRLRRLAQRLTIAEVARSCVASSESSRAYEVFIEEAETDRVVFGPGALARVAQSVRFDTNVYIDLADGVTGLSICLGCGCTWNDACVDAGHPGPCAWVDASERCCTSCAALIKGVAA